MAVGRALSGDELLFTVTEAVVMLNGRYHVERQDQDAQRRASRLRARRRLCRVEKAMIELEPTLFMLAPRKSSAEQLPA
jgi:hypothetical protein